MKWINMLTLHLRRNVIWKNGPAVALITIYRYFGKETLIKFPWKLCKNVGVITFFSETVSLILSCQLKSWFFTDIFPSFFRHFSCNSFGAWILMNSLILTPKYTSRFRRNPMLKKSHLRNLKISTEKCLKKPHFSGDFLGGFF